MKRTTILSALILTIAACGDESSSTGAAAPAPGAPSGKVTAPSAHPAVAAAVADFNLDGRADLAVLTSGAGFGTVSVYYGPLSRSAAPTASEAHPVPATAADLQAVDLDGDQVPDLAVAVAGDESMAGRVHLVYRTVYRGVKRVGEILTGYPARTLAVADVDADGRADLLAGGGAELLVSRSLGSGVFATPVALPALSPFAAGDFDSNGTQEIVGVSAGQPGFLAFYRWEGGSFVRAASVQAPAPVCSIVPASMDGDWALDLAVGCGADVYVLRGLGGYRFEVRAAAGAAFSERLAVGDVNGDSVPDIGTVGGSPEGILESFLGSGYGDWTGMGGPFLAAARDLDAADLDGDGAADLVVCGEEGAEIHFLKP